jgi:hypothetical protein
MSIRFEAVDNDFLDEHGNADLFLEGFSRPCFEDVDPSSARRRNGWARWRGGRAIHSHNNLLIRE